MNPVDNVALDPYTWPFERGAEALELLAQRCGWPMPQCRQRSGELRRPGREIIGSQQLRSDWLVELGAGLGIEVSAVHEQHAQLEPCLRGCAPALLAIESADGLRLMAALSVQGSALCVVDPSGRLCKLPLERVLLALGRATQHQAGPGGELELMLAAAEIAPGRRARLQRVLQEERLAQASVACGWLLRPAIAQPLRQAFRSRRLLQPVIAMLLLYLFQYAILGFGWDAARRGALLGRLDAGWLWAWILAVFCTLPLTAASSWLSARFALEAGSWLRARLLDGILRIDPDRVRGWGAGHLLGRIMEVGALESLGLGGSVLACFAIVDAGVAALLLARGPAAPAMLLLLAAAIAASVLLARDYHRRRLRWTTSRLALTHDLIDRMLGHRTRAVQEPRAARHDAEDRALLAYLSDGLRLDHGAIAISSLARAFLLGGFACLAGALAWGRPSSLELALALAGLLVASRALSSVSSALAHLSSALIAWREVSSLLVAAPAEHAAEPTLACAARTRSARTELVARQLDLRHAGRTSAVLDSVDLTIQAGERILLEGPSGSGKTTLAHVLAGLRKPQAGLLLWNGLDRHTLGYAGWNRRVAVAPQYHDNHVLNASFAFNVLLGRAWPPTAEDLAAAEGVCQEIGLGPLLARMPAGMQQIVGETGWQLSHGERGRLFAARAILSDADLVVLDECVAALDPETATRVLRCARRHTRALMLIAHP